MIEVSLRFGLRGERKSEVTEDKYGFLCRPPGSNMEGLLKHLGSILESDKGCVCTVRPVKEHNLNISPPQPMQDTDLGDVRPKVQQVQQVREKQEAEEVLRRVTSRRAMTSSMKKFGAALVEIDDSHDWGVFRHSNAQ